MCGIFDGCLHFVIQSVRLRELFLRLSSPLGGSPLANLALSGGGLLRNSFQPEFDGALRLRLD